MANILIACEESQVIMTAFRNAGHNAFSNDLKKCSGQFPEYHLQMSCFSALKLKKWHLLIAHPPCTFLTYAGMAHWYTAGRAEKRIQAASFFMKLYNSHVKHICIEQPQGIMNKIFRQPDQIIHPYYFGEREMKRTGLYLKNLPLLQYRLIPDLFSEQTACTKPKPVSSNIQKSTGKLKNRYFTDALINNHFKTSAEKSKSFSSIGTAMAEQWGILKLSNE
jgi:hypothetical protein